jgi:repressor LexA
MATMRVPILAAVGAAKSIDDIEIEGWRSIRKVKNARLHDSFCASPICGDSLEGDGVLDGDFAIIKLTFEPYEIMQGSLVAAYTPYGLLIKHIYYTLNGKVRLVSSNVRYEDILLDAGEVRVQGLVVRIERDL